MQCQRTRPTCSPGSILQIDSGGEDYNSKSELPSVYGFIDISWAQSALMKQSDTCTLRNPGKFKLEVNSRPIHFRELRSASAHPSLQEYQKVMHLCYKKYSSWRPIGAGGGRDQLAPAPYQLLPLARREGRCAFLRTSTIGLVCSSSTLYGCGLCSSTQCSHALPDSTDPDTASSMRAIMEWRCKMFASSCTVWQYMP